jgi:hypothetical protein
MRFFQKAKNDQFCQTCSKKGHETLFLTNFSINLIKKLFFGYIAKILLIQKCVANEKSLEDTTIKYHWAI